MQSAGFCFVVLGLNFQPLPPVQGAGCTFALAPKLRVKSPFKLIEGSRQLDHAGQVTRHCCVPFFYSSFPWPLPKISKPSLTQGWAAPLENNVDVQREISEQKLRSVSVQIKQQMDLVCVGADNSYRKAITRLWPAHPGKNPLGCKSSVVL